MKKDLALRLSKGHPCFNLTGRGPKTDCIAGRVVVRITDLRRELDNLLEC